MEYSFYMFNNTIWKYIFLDIYEKCSYLPVVILWGILGGLLLYFVLIKKYFIFENSRTSISCWILFAIYVVLLIKITILEREFGSRVGISLRLFGTFGDSRANAYVVENLLLFIPYGTLLPPIWKRANHGVVCIFTGAITSVAIEITQLLTQRGYFQVDDIVMNTLGTVCGYLVYRIIKWIVKERT